MPALGVLLAPTVVLIIIAFVVTPRVELLFREFKLELPGMTKIALRVAGWIRNDRGWLLLLPLPVGISVIVPAVRGERKPSQPPRRTEPP